MASPQPRARSGARTGRRGVAAALLRLAAAAAVLLLSTQQPRAVAVAQQQQAGGASGDTRMELEFRMPGVTTTERDEYWCMNVELPAEPLNLVAIEPIARQEVVHHMLIYGCAEPAVGDKRLYQCGMQLSGICKGGVSAPVYGWGKNAPGIAYPEGVGYQVGPGTAFAMLVVEMHYLEPQPQGDSESGVRLTLDRRERPLTAGIASIAANFVIPPGKPAWNIHLGCCVDSLMPVHAFAMRVHTHSLGEMVAIGSVGEGPPGGAAAAPFFAKRDPREPQGFYELPQGVVTLPRGTRLGGGCLFNSTTRGTVTEAGARHGDEMCNVYLMLFGELAYQTVCFPKEGEASSFPGELPAAARPLARDPDWRVRMPPSGGGIGGRIGQVSAVQAVEGGRAWVFRRGGRVWDDSTFDPATNEIAYSEPIPEDCVLKVDTATGAVVQSWGAGAFYMPHGLTVDHEGNLWLTDAGLHQVFKFSPGGSQLLALGEALRPGAGPGQFCKPTHVAVSLQGDFFVADGYCNSRVVHFSPEGHIINVIEPGGGSGSPGGGGSAAAEMPFEIPHSLLLDECKGILLVADRLNGFIRAFAYRSPNNPEIPHLRAAVGEVGLPYALAPGPYGSVVALLWEAPGRSHVMQLQWSEAVSDTGTHVRIASLDTVSTWEVSSPGGAAARAQDSPHDIALLPGPPPALGDGIREREIQLLLADTHDPKDGGGSGGLFLFKWRQPQGPAAKKQPPPAGEMMQENLLRGPTDEDGEATIVVQDDLDLGETIQRLYAYGAPFALAFAALAFFLWRRLNSLQDEMMREQAASLRD